VKPYELEGLAMALNGVRLDVDMKTVVFPETIPNTMAEEGSSCTRCAIWVTRSGRPAHVREDGSHSDESKVMDVECRSCGRGSRVTIRKADALVKASERLIRRKNSSPNPQRT
jgi:RNase P subunit RPR2